MKLAKALLITAAYMPEWVYGRVFLAKLALAYMLINSLAKAGRLEA